MKRTIENIRKLNPTVAEVLEEKFQERNFEAFDKILANFIKLNCN